MKIHGTRIIPAQPERQETIVVDIQCDLCDRPGGQEESDGSIRWTTRNPYEVERVAVVRDRISCYPEGTSLDDRQSYHVCPTCLEDVVFPFLQDQVLARKQ